MAHRFGVFIAVIIFGLGVLIARPWIPGGDGHGLIFVFGVVGVAAYAFVRGLGWIFG